MQENEGIISAVYGITARQRLMLLIVVVFGHGVKHLLNSAFFILLPNIKAGMGFSNTQVGILSAFRGISGGLANLPAGFIGDRYSSRRAGILGLSIVLVSVFAFALGMATSFWVAVIAASLFSIAISFWHPSAISSLSREFTSRRGFAIALHGTGGSVGETLGPILVGSLLMLMGWRMVLQMSLIPGLLFGLVIWSLLRTVPVNNFSDSSLSEYWRSVVDLLSNGKLILVLIFAAGFAGGQSAILTFLPIYLDENMGASSVTIGFYLSLAQVGGIVSQPLLGYMSDRLGRKMILVPSLAILGITFIALVAVPSGWMFGIVILIMGAFLFPLMAILLAAAVDLAGIDSQATTVSLVFGAAIVVSAFVPALAGVLADAIATEAAFVFAGGLVLSTSLLSGLTRWHPVEHGV